MLAAVLAALPPYRANGDDAIVQVGMQQKSSRLDSGAHKAMRCRHLPGSALNTCALSTPTPPAQRIIKRPNSALEALARAPMELFYGFSAAGCGLLMDPIAVRGRGGQDGGKGLGLWGLEGGRGGGGRRGGAGALVPEGV